MEILGKLTLSDYLKKAERQLSEEMGRLQKYLTWPGIEQ